MAESSLTFGRHCLFGSRTGAGSRTTARASRPPKSTPRTDGIKRKTNNRRHIDCYRMCQKIVVCDAISKLFQAYRF
jgi:hypothetical protein